MKCPNDGTTLAMTTREGIEIDYCPECRGVWLDRGELDKLIERSVPSFGGGESHPAPSQPTHYEQPKYPPKYHDSDYRHDPRYHHKRRKESFLGDLFDF